MEQASILYNQFIFHFLSSMSIAQLFYCSIALVQRHRRCTSKEAPAATKDGEVRWEGQALPEFFYLALSIISIISFSTAAASSLSTSGKNCDIVAGFIDAIFTLPSSSRILILQGINTEINLLLFKK